MFTGDNTLPIGTVGVPRTIAKRLFRTERVQPWNVSRLQQLLDRHPRYPSIVTVIRGDVDLITSVIKRHKKSANSFQLRIGDVVERHLMEGDDVVVNRQPTLAKNSIICHKVKITDSLTLSLNILMTDNLAADCDGDEINIYVPETESFKSSLFQAEYNVVFNKNGKISQKLKQDSLRGCFSIT